MLYKSMIFNMFDIQQISNFLLLLMNNLNLLIHTFINAHLAMYTVHVVDLADEYKLSKALEWIHQQI